MEFHAAVSFIVHFHVQAGLFVLAMAVAPEVAQKLKALLEKAEKESMVSCTRAICTLLKENGLMYEVKVHSRYIGVHPLNRDGFGVSAAAVQSLISNVAHIGWEWSAVKTLAVEVNDANYDSVHKFNSVLVETSMGALAPLDDRIKFASLEGSHTNQALRCFHASSPHPNDSLTEEGRLSLAKLKAKDPEFFNAATNGMTWQILSADIVDMFPSLAHVLQAAGNASGQVAQGEPEIQVMRRVYNSWRAELLLATASGHTIDFTRVKARVLASSTLHSDVIPHVYTFLLKFGGGQTADLLNETEGFVRHNGAATRKLGPLFFQALGLDARGKSESMLVRLRHALLKLGYMPEETVTKGDVNKLIHSNDVQVIRKSTEAETLMAELREGFKQNGIYNKCVHILHMFDTDAVRFMLGRKLPRKYASVAGIAYDAVKLAVEQSGVQMISLLQKFEHAGSLTEDWLAPETVSAYTMTSVMRELDTHGRLKNTETVYAAKGYVVGAHLRRKQDGEFCTAVLSSFNSDGSVSLDTGGPGHAQITIAELASWSVFKPKGEAFTDVSALQAHKSEEFEMFVAKAKVALAVQTLMTEHAKSYDSIQLMLGKPRSVTTTRSFNKGTLIIVPASMKITIKECTRDQVPNGVAYCGEAKTGHHCWLAQHTVLPNDTRSDGFVCAWWFIDVGDEPDDGNMVLTTVKVAGHDSLKIPVLKNIKPLKDGDKLSLVQHANKSDDKGQEPKKKARKSA
jgi:hypothetical protein